MVPLLQLVFVESSVVSYVAFVISLLAPHRLFLRYLGKGVLRDCGISCVFSPTGIYRYSSTYLC